MQKVISHILALRKYVSSQRGHKGNDAAPHGDAYEYDFAARAEEDENLESLD